MIEDIKIQINGKEETGRSVYYAMQAAVEYDVRLYGLEVILVESYYANNDSYDYEVGEITWMTPMPDMPEDAARIEEAVRKYLSQEMGRRS